MYKFVAGFALMMIVLWGCKDELNKTGLGILPTGDLVNVLEKTIDKGNIKAYTVTDEKQRTDETLHNLLGSYNDPIFGKSTVDFASQLRLLSYPNFRKNDKIDSLVYYLAYKELYGDTIPTPQKLKVYELASDLSFDAKYYQDEKLKALAKSEVLAEKDYTPKFKLDSLTSTYGSTKKAPKDTVTQVIAFHLNNSLATKLMAADSATLSSNDPNIKTGNKGFLDYFKGLYVEAGDLNQRGTIMKILNLGLGSGMVLFFHKDNDTTKYSYTFNVSKFSARVNRFTHDYSAPLFLAKLDKKDQLDSLIYLQTTGGLASKIYIPKLSSLKLLFPELGKDTTKLAINKAELIFQVDETLTDKKMMKVLLPPYKVILSAIAADGSLYFPADLAFSQSYFGGYYNSVDKTYRFNLAKHLQEMIDKKKGRENYGFYLSTDARNTIFRRVILKGTTSKTGIRLNITYSKLN
jgi:hypothetical protein